MLTNEQIVPMCHACGSLSLDRRLPKADIRSTKFIRRSLMPEGLLDALQDKQVADLLAYLMTLKG